MERFSNDSIEYYKWSLKISKVAISEIKQRNEGLKQKTDIRKLKKMKKKKERRRWNSSPTLVLSSSTESSFTDSWKRRRYWLQINLLNLSCKNKKLSNNPCYDLTENLFMICDGIIDIFIPLDVSTFFEYIFSSKLQVFVFSKFYFTLNHKKRWPQVFTLTMVDISAFPKYFISIKQCWDRKLAQLKLFLGESVLRAT